MLGIVGELFVVEKYLFARSKDELSAAINALQDSIGELHDRLPREREINPEIGHEPTKRAAPVSLSSYLLPQQGPGPQTCRGDNKSLPLHRKISARSSSEEAA